MMTFSMDALPRGAECVTPFAPRQITHAFHDIDGTHSLIRDWVPVMTLVLGFVRHFGLASADVILPCRDMAFPEEHTFSVESAGLSALTQMEWAIRGALETGSIRGIPFEPSANRAILNAIERGEEKSDIPELPETRAFLAEKTPELFRIYETLLRRMSRDENLSAARLSPEKWRVPGSAGFLRLLHKNGVRNYFVTGAVVEYDAAGNPGGCMYEEIEALGLAPRPGGVIEALTGSVWNEKWTKAEIMRRICEREKIDPSRILVIGDGRTEIEAGVRMGALTVSRLSEESVRARQIHRALHTNIIVANYTGFGQCSH